MQYAYVAWTGEYKMSAIVDKEERQRQHYKMLHELQNMAREIPLWETHFILYFIILLRNKYAWFVCGWVGGWVWSWAAVIMPVISDTSCEYFAENTSNACHMTCCQHWPTLFWMEQCLTLCSHWKKYNTLRKKLSALSDCVLSMNIEVWSVWTLKLVKCDGITWRKIKTHQSGQSCHDMKLIMTAFL